MGWTAPRTWALNDLVTPAMMNEQVRDNLLVLRNPPTCRATQTTGTSLTSASYTTLSFNAEAWDSDGMHSTSTNAERVTAITAGKYLVTASMSFTGSATTIGLQLSKNGTAIAYQVGDSSAGTSGASVQTIVDLSAGDYVTVAGYQNSGSAKTTHTASTALAALWVAP